LPFAARFDGGGLQRFNSEGASDVRGILVAPGVLRTASASILLNSSLVCIGCGVLLLIFKPLKTKTRHATQLTEHRKQTT
jgi:hypothetical protein